MFSIAEFLDRAKLGAGIESDYRLAKVLGVGHSRVSNWRRGENTPDERAIVKLCEMSGDDPGAVAASVQAMRAANVEAANLWQQIAERLSGPATAKLAALFALVFVAQFMGGTDAAATGALLLGSVNNVYVVSICLLVALFATRPGWRLLTMVHRAVRTYKA